MSELARKIVFAIGSGNAAEAQQAFEEATSERMLAALEVKRTEVAKTMFSSPVVEESVEQPDNVLSEANMSGIAHEVERDAEHHSHMKVNWGESGKRHEENFNQHEADIKRKHGEKALDHIRKASEAHEKGTNYMFNERGDQVHDGYHQMHWDKINHHTKEAVKAAIDHHSKR